MSTFFPGDSAFDASGFRVLHETETGPDYDHGCTNIHADGTECDCRHECIEVCDEYYLAEFAGRFPDAGGLGPLPQ